MNRTRMLDFIRGCIVIGVAFFWLMSFDWFRILVRNLFIGVICLGVILLTWYCIKAYRRLKER